MKLYEFYQDQKISLWKRFFFQVKAENYDKAVEKVKSVKNEDILCVEDDDLYNAQGDHIVDNSNDDTVESVEVTSLSVEDLQQLGFDTSKVTTEDLKNIAYKMDLSETFWIVLEHQAERYGLKKNK